ncbi:MAG: hypothetical protein J6T87_00545 [Bacteroidales bacterium]|nr:hypothetical protein [Bacteroidales bacterium]
MINPTNSPFCAKEGNIQRLNSKIRAFFFLVCCLAFGGMAFAQEQVTLTFTGANSQGDYVQLSSVEIRNLSRNWSETIVFPDTVYTLPVGTIVPQNPQEREMQVMPNPFDGHTRVNISSVETENVRMTLTDINGRQHAEYSGTLLSGDNYFEISLTMPQTYILTVRTVSGVRSLKMVNTGHGGVNRIKAAERSPRPVEVRLRNTSAHAFQPGDLMEFTGHTSILGTPMTSVTVTQQQFHSEEILLVFNPASSAETVVTTDSIIFNGNDAFYAYGTVQSDIPVTARGFCWGTEHYPTIADNRTLDGTGTGVFFSTIAGLDLSQTYYARAYATTDSATLYGTEYLINLYSNYTNSQTKFIPDGQDCGEGCLLASYINITDQPAGSVIQSEEDIRYVRIKLEHSWAGDLWIALQCPNGSYASILKKYNNGASSECSIHIPVAEWGWSGWVSSSGHDFGIKGYSDNTSNKCDSATNPIGTPWNYVWSYNTRHGYVYNPGYYVYYNDNIVSVYGQTVMDSTNVADMTNVFHPDGSFSSLVGCPLNGTWSLMIVDGWALDNGWLDEWELAFDGAGLALPTAPVISASPCPQAASATDHDGNVYATVAIGEQCWMRENLRTTHTADGTAIAQSTAIDADVMHYYLPDVENGDNYGYLYNWKAAKAVCPPGWRLPTDEDWTRLTDFLGGIDTCVCGDNPTNVAKAVAATEGWNFSDTPCAVGAEPAQNNLTNFSALPAGTAYGISVDAGTAALFWTATPYNDNFVYYRALRNDYGHIERNSYGNKASGMSVRCVYNPDALRPSVTTADASDITNTSVLCGGTVVDEGDFPVTERGVCWSSAATPTVADEHTSDGSGAGSFVSALTNLTPGTIYFARAYATNAIGTAYGPQVTFTTKDIPTVITGQILDMVDTFTTCGGNVTSYSGDPVTARGICWCTYPNTPTLADSHTVNGAGTGEFSSDITGLEHGTAYRVRAYATNSYGTAYGTVRSFTTKGVPTVIVYPVTDITSISASCTGWVTQDNGSAQIERGICWSTQPNPTIADNHIAASTTGVGYYTLPLTGLTPGTTYHVRAYGTNGVGTGYSDEVTFTTLTLPTLITDSVTNIDFYSATCSGEVLNNGVPAISERGFCWSTSHNPTIADNHCIDSTLTGTGFGTFSVQLTGLATGFHYYVRAYATNSSGTAYGNEVEFSTAYTCGNPVTDIQGNVYNTMQIGQQCWMAENLRTTAYAPNLTNAPSLSHPTSFNYTACFMNAYYYYPNNDTANVSTYGLLYNWLAAMGGASSSNSTPSGVQGICPEGWHLPSQNEFNTLIQQSGSSSFLGTILPGEYFAGNNGHLGFGTWAYFWTSTSTDNVYGDACGVSCNGSNPTLSPYEEQGHGFSVRCLRD